MARPDADSPLFGETDDGTRPDPIGTGRADQGTGRAGAGERTRARAGARVMATVWCSICGKGLYKCKCRNDLQARAQAVSLAYAQKLGLTEFPMRSDNPPEADVRLFREIAETLYGPHPADLLADALEVNIRSVQRWLNGQNEVPQGIWNRLHALLLAQSGALEKLLGRSADDVQ